MKKIKGNIVEKGASIQRDMETFAIIPYFQAGMIDPPTLHKIANIAEKYDVKMIKTTSEGRISLYGIKENDLNKIWEDLGMKPGGHMGSCVRPVKNCIGNVSCKNGLQNSIEMSREIDELYLGIKTPRKLKIAVSGCPNSCAESYVRDIGVIGTGKGWNLFVGGTCGLKPRIGKLLAKNLSDDDLFRLIGKIIDYYKDHGMEKRVGAFIDEIGFETFSREILN